MPRLSLLLSSALLSACLLTGCGATPAAHSGTALPHKQTLPDSSLPTSPSGLPVLAPPSAYLQELQKHSSKAASYVVSDLSKTGAAFEGARPHALLSVSGSEGLYSPNWTTGNGESGLAFGLYSFTIPEYGGDSSLNYSFSTSPAAFGDAYFAFANWGENRWDWYRGNAASSIHPASLAPYFVFNGGMLVCVALTGQTPCSLSSLRIGSAAPVPSLTVSQASGLLPLSVHFDASGSTDPDSSIAEYRWDPDGDGVFDQSSATTPSFDFQYDTAGTYHAGLRVIDDQGVYADAEQDIRAFGGINFTYGGTPTEECDHLLPAPNGDVLVVGIRRATAIDYDAIFARFGLDASLVFCRYWGTANKRDLLDGACSSSDGSVYACGSTNGGVSTADSGLLQHWSADGELLWSKTYSQDSAMLGFRAMTNANGALYACGSYEAQAVGHSFPLVVKLDLDGNVLWTAALTTASFGSFDNASFSSSLVIGKSTVQLCGLVENTDTLHSEALYAAFDEAGNLKSCQTLGDASTFLRASAIAVSTNGIKTSTYICGYDQDAAGAASNFICHLGSSPVAFTAANTDAFAPHCLSLGGPGGLSVVMTRNVHNSTSDSIVVANLDSSLGIVSAVELSSLPDGTNYPLSTLRSGSSLLVGGWQSGSKLPVQGSLTVSSNAGSFSWTDFAPGVSTPVFSVDATSLTTLDGSPGCSFNRLAADRDMGLVMVP